MEVASATTPTDRPGSSRATPPPAASSNATQKAAAPQRQGQSLNNAQRTAVQQAGDNRATPSNGQQRAAGQAQSRPASPFAQKALDAYSRTVQAQNPQAGRRLFQPTIQNAPRNAPPANTQGTTAAKTQSGRQAPQMATASPGARAIFVNTSPLNPPPVFTQISLSTSRDEAADPRLADVQAGARTYRSNAGIVAAYARGNETRASFNV